MLQADKSASTTRWPRRANSASAVDLPVADIPVIRTRVISSKLSRLPQADLSRSGSGSSEATSKHAAGIPLRGRLVAQAQPGHRAVVLRQTEGRHILGRQPVALSGPIASWDGRDSGSLRA